MTVSFEHTVDAPGLDTADGTVRLDLSVATADGWSAPLGSSAVVAVQDGAATASADIDPTLAASLVGRHNAEIGGSPGSASIVVTPVVDVTGTVQGQPFTASELAPLTFTMDTVAVRPPGTDAAFAPTGAVLGRRRRGGVAHVHRARRGPADRRRPAHRRRRPGARRPGRRRRRLDRPAAHGRRRGRVRRPQRRADPAGGRARPGRSVVDVSDAQALRRVAERVDGLVLHHAGPEGQTFAVQDNETTYRFVFPDTAITRTPPPPPPPVARLVPPVTVPLPRIA